MAELVEVLIFVAPRTVVVLLALPIWVVPEPVVFMVELPVMAAPPLVTVRPVPAVMVVLALMAPVTSRAVVGAALPMPMRLLVVSTLNTGVVELVG